MLAGRIGDLISRRRIFLIGVGVFTAASFLCGLAQSQEVLIGARFVQGVGGAMTSAVILGMIVTMFPEPRPRRSASTASFGDKAWWLPAWLDSIVPNIALEGHLVANSDSMGKPVAGHPAADPARA